MLLSAGHVLSADMISRIRKYAMAEGIEPGAGHSHAGVVS